MSRLRVSIAVVALLAMAGGAVWVGSAAARGGVGQAVLVRLHAGDQVAISGAHIRCAVSSGLPRTIACGLGNARSPFVGTYEVAVADQAVLLLKAAQAAPVLVLREAQPKVSVSSFPVAAGRPRTLTVGVGTALMVAGSHVFCAVTSQGAIAVVCGLTASNSGVYIPGTYLGVITPRQAVLWKKLPGDKVKTVISRRQP
jgi:hypothetical protein